MGARQKIIARMHGGLGNQLFIYAAARQIAYSRDAELLLDCHSAFSRDRRYGALSQLQHFAIPTSVLNYGRWMPPQFDAYVFAVKRRLFGSAPLAKRFVASERDFEDLCANAPVRDGIILNGYWQSERYFPKAAHAIKEALQITSPLSVQSQAALAEIEATNAICLHVRQRRGAHHNFTKEDVGGTPQLPFRYYEDAVAYVSERVVNPVFFCFGDNVDWIRERWIFPFPAHIVDHNKSQETAYQDLALAKSCKHFVIGNSTFSWWAAWLGETPQAVITAPANVGRYRWASEPNVIPDRWTTFPIAGA